MRAQKNVEPRVTIKDGHLLVTWANEAELRSGIARVARAYGWWVREEVVVPGWGRIDLVLRRKAGGQPFLVELKTALNKPNEVRRAFQQADGYGRWWTQHHGEANTAVVCSPKPNMQIIQPVADAYPTVPYRSATSLIDGLLNWNIERSRIDAAAERVAAARRELEIDELAHQELRMLAAAKDETAAWAEQRERELIEEVGF